MSKNRTLWKAVARVRGEASAARAFFHAWKTFEMARGDAEHLAAMNDPRYADFFLASMPGNFRLFSLSLGNILDRTKGSLGISRLQKLLKKSGHDNLAHEIKELCENYRNTIDGVRYIRNNSIAHKNLESIDKIFKKASVTPNQIEALIDAICNVLNRITVEFGRTDSISEGKRNEKAAQNILEAVRASRLYKIETLGWIDVRGFFEEYGCVIAGKPEIEWYRTAWAALERAELTCSGKLGSFQVDLATVKRRALCLLVMYLGVYQAAGEFSQLGGYFSGHPPISWYLDSLNMEMEDIWELARREGIIDTGSSSFWEDEDIDMDQLCEIAMDLTLDERDVIYKALVEHYSGNEGLFVSWWNSRSTLGEGNSWGDIVASADPDDGTLEAWCYVQNGMKGFWWD